MVAAVTSGITNKINVLKKAIVAHLDDKQRGIAPHISACCMDLALRVAYAEVSTMKDPFSEEVHTLSCLGLISKKCDCVIELLLLCLDVGCQNFVATQYRHPMELRCCLDSHSAGDAASVPRAMLSFLLSDYSCTSLWGAAFERSQ